MYGSGAAIGIQQHITKAVQAAILKALQVGLPVCCAVAVGATVPRAAGWLIAATTPPAIATPTSDFG